MLPGQSDTLGVVASLAASFRFNPVTGLLHGFTKGAVLVINRDWFNLLSAGTHDEHSECATDNCNCQEISFSYLHQLMNRLLQITPVLEYNAQTIRPGLLKQE